MARCSLGSTRPGSREISSWCSKRRLVRRPGRAPGEIYDVAGAFHAGTRPGGAIGRRRATPVLRRGICRVFLLLLAALPLRAEEEPAQPKEDSARKPKVHLTTMDLAVAPGSLPIDPAGVIPTAPRAPGSATVSTGDKERRTDFIVAPIPMSNPTFGSGLGAVGAVLFPLNRSDKVTPLSVAGIGGFYTDSGSYALGLGIKAYLDQDNWRLLVGGAVGSLHYDFFGSGLRNTGPESVPLVQKVSGLAVEGLRRVSGRLFVGARYIYATSTLDVDSGAENPVPEPPERDLLTIQLAALGLHAQADSRDSTFYPSRGGLFDLKADFYEPGVGSDRTFQAYGATYNRYHSLGELQVIALRASGCSVRGDAPVYALCLFGSGSDLRGYVIGRYLDRAMLALQAEYRLSLPERLGFFGRFGLAAFAGVGQVAESLSDFESDQLLPSGGVGLRFLLTKENRINFRIDYAWGKDGSKGLYVGVGEAF